MGEQPGWGVGGHGAFGMREMVAKHWATFQSTAMEMHNTCNQQQSHTMYSVVFQSTETVGCGDSNVTWHVPLLCRLNVAISRGKHATWIVGNAHTLGLKDPTWQALIRDAKDRGCFFTASTDPKARMVCISFLMRILVNICEARWCLKFSQIDYIAFTRVSLLRRRDRVLLWHTIFQATWRKTSLRKRRFKGMQWLEIFKCEDWSLKTVSCRNNSLSNSFNKNRMCQRAFHLRPQNYQATRSWWHPMRVRESMITSSRRNKRRWSVSVGGKILVPVVE